MELSPKKKIGLPKIHMTQTMVIFIITIIQMIVETGRIFHRQDLPLNLDINPGVL